MRILSVLMLFLMSPAWAQTFDEVLKRGDEFYVAQNYQEAIKFFSQAITINNKQVKGYWYRADAYRQLRQYAEAAADYTKALELEPNNVKFLTRRGDCYYSTNQFQLAIDDYTRGLGLDKNNATLLLYRGDCYVKLGDNNNACDDYQQAFELGNKSAKVQARQVNCDWVRALAKPCPTGEAPINRVVVEPFTGAVIVGRGLTFEKFEAVTLDDKVITGPVYAMNEEFNFRITKPRNFCPDDEQAVFFGIGVTLSEGDKSLIAVNNIYEGQEQGVVEESIKGLSGKIDFQSPMEIGKSYSLVLRFFDTRGNGQVVVNIPVMLASSTRAHPTVLRTESTLGPGILTAGVGIEPVKLESRLKGRKEILKSYNLYRNLTYTVALTVKTPWPKTVDITQRFILADGTSLQEKPGRAVINQNQLVFDISTIGLKPGAYKLLTRITDTESINSLSLVIPITVR